MKHRRTIDPPRAGGPEGTGAGLRKGPCAPGIGLRPPRGPACRGRHLPQAERLHGPLLSRWIALALLLAAGGLAPEPATAGAQPARIVPPPATAVQALDAALRAREAERAGDAVEAISSWTQAAALAPQALPPRLALARLNAWRDPSRAATELRAAAGIAWTEYTASRWIVAHALPGAVLAACLAALLLVLGILLRHLRPFHHLLHELLAFSFRAGRWTAVLAGAALFLPIVAGLGLAGAALCLAFAISFRFSARERLLTLGAAALLLLSGPTLWAVRPLWGQAPDGRDARLLAEIQHDPASGPSRDAVRAWLRADPDGAAPRYLAALGAIRDRAYAEAVSDLTRAAGHAELPPAVLETDLGLARQRQGRSAEAVEHYARAMVHDPECFEAAYNLGLIRAERADFVGADEAMDRAAAIDLERLRTMGRVSPGTEPRPPAEAVLSHGALWSWQLQRPAAGITPRPLRAILPLAHPLWSVPVLLLAILLGLLAASSLRRQPAIHVCFQCGTPICRRCLRRADRRAYCQRCASQVGSAGVGQSTRILLQRLIEHRPSTWTRLRPWLEHLLPGVGCAARGHPLAALPAAVLAGVAIALGTGPSWAAPSWIVPAQALGSGPVWPLVLLLFAAASAANALALRLAARRDRGLRAFFERDLDRLAA